MNILQILPSLDAGGVETGTVDLARYLIAHGHRAVVVSGGGNLVRELDVAGVRHYTLPVGKKSIISVISMIGRLKDIIRAEDIDIVHARSRVPAMIAYFACRATGRVFVTTAHGYYSSHPLSQAMAWGKYVIVASNIMAKHMTGVFGLPHERIRLIPRGVDLARFRYHNPKIKSSGEFVIGMVSRITPLKGHVDFIKSAAILKRHIPRLKALIVGRAPKEKYLEDLELLVRKLGLSDIIEFTGSRSDIPDLLTRMDVVVSATITPEAFGRTIIEAQAVGVPVVATKVGGVVDVIDDEKTGLFCARQSPKDMADKILRIYKDDNLRVRMVNDARKKVESEFSLTTMAERTIGVYNEAYRKKNILVIKVSAIGDVILSMPSLRSIRAKYPQARIKVLVGLSSRQVLAGCPYIDDLIVCNFQGRDGGIKGIIKLAGRLQKECFDMVVDFQNNKKSHLISFLTMAGERYGYDNGKWSFFLNNKIKDNAPYLDPIDHQSRVLNLLGTKNVDKRLELWPSDYDDQKARKLLHDNWIKPAQAMVGINVRASSRWSSKNWPQSYIVELCDRLAKEFNVRVILTGADVDLDFARRIARSAKSKPLVLAGKTSIMELAALISLMKVFISPDSAPMHIASAVGTPLIALFGPTSPERHLVSSENSMLFYNGKKFKCSPCYSPVCRKKVTCMKSITVDEVLVAIREYLNSYRPHAFLHHSKTIGKEGVG